MSAAFVKSCLDVAFSRAKAIGLLNLVFFGCVFCVVAVAQLVLPPPLYSGWSPSIPGISIGGFWLALFLVIFLFNLGMSAFIFLTLPGVAFFPSSVGFLLFRAVLWGLLLYELPNWLFFAVLPTLVLEGEAYVFAGVAGVVVGASWVKPDLLYRGEDLSRVDAFRRALREFLRLYFFVVVFLLVAAIVETVTIVWIG